VTQLSEKELANGSLQVWYDWLREGLMVFTSDRSLAVRYDAFAPLLVDPNSATPAIDLYQQIRSIDVQEPGVAERAAIEALRTWSLAADGWRPAELLISLAARLGGLGLAEAVWRLIARSGDLPQEARLELAFVAVQAASHRYKETEIYSLADLLWKEELRTPTLLAELALLLARKDHGGLQSMPRKLAEMLPGLMVPPHTGIDSDAIAKALRLHLSPEELRSGLSPVPSEPKDVAHLREILFRRAVPQGGGEVDEPLEKVVNLEHRRLAAMGRLAEIPYPAVVHEARDEGTNS